MGFWQHQLAGPTDPSHDAAWEEPEPRKGFFTDTSICIGCKACEVACKEWNAIPEDGLSLTGHSYDNTGSLGASTWRHVAFIEQTADRVEEARESGKRLVDLGMPALRPPDAPHPGPSSAAGTAPAALEGVVPTAVVDDGSLDAMAAAARAAEATGTLPDFRWLMASDVCKHCTHAGCLDVCPTGALFRTEHGTVVVQPDVCNGCGYCVAACPFGVIERREDERDDKRGGGVVSNVGVAQKCTLCYDRLGHDQTPACAQACPTTSIKFGTLAEMLDTARDRVEVLHDNGFTEARLYGANAHDGVGGTGSVFLLLDEPEVYGLPPDPRVPTADLPDMFRKAGIAAVAMFGMAVAAFAGRRR
jgi:formate dehydrogenase iron-sulfur subunit